MHAGAQVSVTSHACSVPSYLVSPSAGAKKNAMQPGGRMT
jgi:hypothetical protein